MKYKKIISVFSLAFVVVFCGCCEKKHVKIAVFDTTFGAQYENNPAVFDKAKELGFEGVQISRLYKSGGKFASPEEIAAYKAKMVATGLKTPSIVVAAMPLIDNPDAPRYMQTAIDAAAELGAKNILVSCFGKDKLSDDNLKLVEAKFAPFVAALKLIMPYAEKKGVNICLEDTLTAAENNRVIDAVGSPNLKVYFDIFNIVYYGHDEISNIEGLKGRIGEVHLKDEAHKFGVSKTKPKDFNACLDALRRIGFDGWYCFEVHNFDYKKDDIDSTMKFNLDYTRKHIK